MPAFLLRMRRQHVALLFINKVGGSRRGLSIRLSGIFTYPASFWNQGVRIIEVLLYSVIIDFLSAQLFVETSLRTLTSKTLNPTLSKLLPLLETTHHSSDSVHYAAHTLTLPLLSVTLTKSRGKSHDLQDRAVRILCKSVTEFVSSQEESETDKDVSVTVCLRRQSDINSTNVRTVYHCTCTFSSLQARSVTCQFLLVFVS